MQTFKINISIQAQIPRRDLKAQLFDISNGLKFLWMGLHKLF